MSGFIEWLEKLNEKETRAKAILRRSLAFEPGTYVHAFPYVEPFLKDEENSWRREVHYMVAGLWASHWREGRTGQPMPIGAACAAYQVDSGSTSVEKRFISLLDADTDQLPHRIRQMVALLKDQSIDFEAILKGLLNWTDNQKRTQNTWARDFYHNLHDWDAESKDEKEIKK